MKKNIKVCLIFFTILLLILIINFSIILNKTKIIKKDNQMQKEMSSSSKEIELNMQLTEANKSATEYANYMQTCKTLLASTISDEGVSTSENDTFEKMVTNIGDIFVQRTKLDESIAATADNIFEGKQAYVNGELITGTMKNSDEYISLGVYQNANVIKNVLTIDVTKYTDKYQELSSSNFIVVTDTAVAQAKGGNGTVLSWSATKNYNSTNGTLQITTSDTQTGGLWIGANSGLLYVFLKM